LAPPVPPKLPDFVKSIDRNAGNVQIWLKDGTKESYDLKVPAEKEAFEKKYGNMPDPPAPPVPPTAPSAPVKIVSVNGANNLSSIADKFEITDKKAVMHLKSGVTEEYDLTNEESRRKFEMKFGKIINTNVNAGVNANINTTSHVNISSQVNTNNNIHTQVTPVAIVSQTPGVNVISTVSPAVAAGRNIQAVDPYGHIITGDEETIVTITKKTTAAQLEEFKKQMKQKGIELNFDDMDFDNGKLVRISGTMKSKDGKSKSTFSVTDFHQVKLASIKNGDKTYFKVNVTDNKTVI
jgi:hypothetical protein